MTDELRLELDPLSLIIKAMKGHILLCEGQYDDSIKQLKLILEIDDKFLPAHIFLTWNYIMKEMYQEALSINQKASFYHKDSILPLLDNILIHAHSGQREKAKAMFENLLQQTPIKNLAPLQKAGIYNLLGETDKAFEWIENAYDERGLPPNLVKYALWFDSIRSDPRYKALLKKINLE